MMKAVSARVAEHAIDIAAVAGAGLISYGADLIYRPACFIVAGGFLLAGAWLTARNPD